MKSISKHPTKSNAFEPIIFIFGPTGVGKTELLLDLDPQRFSVINADSIQVYRHLDIGSAKASKAVRSAIEHHLIDICDPWEQFSVGNFIERADQACQMIHDQGKIPVISGGTAYYFKHFLYGLSEAPLSDENIRKSLSQRIETEGREWAYQYLQRIDPISAKRIHPSDMYRVSRALEVWETSGRPLSSYTIPTTVRNGMKPLVIGLIRESEVLRRRLNLRVQAMFDEGLVEEIRDLLKMGAQSWWPGLQGIGYREFFQAMEHGEWSRAIIADQIERNSRLYAKRQMTFFKSFADAKWFDPENKATILTEIERYLQGGSR
ncbi:tRNA (adenosine(37)-N6)-dimethylallyltransferase MiaA [Sphaerochaeta globosa]|uniref:tRNA dimethylallyltransferase n=1 Tax=Sphaerochaeta globosa (strain ATCC BAA-1886 / DSM 22777 / Buddy) TaxID=158189 RepID=F0RWH3_SPHGB|nr:tRNA (adenosine(37)-N6)-dimethylallyltransferase MiaA [Sphaerochaeta globosa]ADY13604.1 tRNA dimethylallyltransferase [Sphaerochaeta globosa str. Buddy]